MVVLKSNVMYSCQVFCIGCRCPSEHKKGVEALQNPLKELYKGDVSLVEGYDVTVTVMPEMVHVKYSNDVIPEFTMPISSLSICAAVRCVQSHSDEGNMKFIPVHSVITANEPDSEHPAIFATVMRRSEDRSQPPECYAFICNSTRDALHMVNATQTAHTALRRGYSPTGAMKFFIDQTTEFDRTIRVNSTSNDRKTETKKIYTYHEDFDTRNYNNDSRTYVTTGEDTNIHRYNHASKIYNGTNVVLNGEAREDTTYYVKAGDYRPPTPERLAEPETIVVGLDVNEQPAPPPPAQQTIIIDKPIMQPPRQVVIPKPKIIERPVYIDCPPPPKIEPQTIYVDKPIMKEYAKVEIPKPIIIERPCVIEPPPPPKMEPQKIIIDKPIVQDYLPPPAQPAPIIQENPVYIKAPQWPEQKPQRIVVDKPVLKEIGPPPPQPKPIIEVREIPIDPPEYPVQKAHKIIVEQPKFNPHKPAPPPPPPIIECKDIFIDLPPYPVQERQKIIIEKPCINDPGPPPKAPPPEIIEKAVYIDLPKYPPQEPQRIIVEKAVVRDRGPPPPPPKPIIIEKIVYIDLPPWPVQEPQRIVVEKPVFRQRPPRPPVKPVIIQKPVYIDAPEPQPQPAQKIIVERPIVRGTTYGMSETRRVPSAYNYNYQYRPTNVRSSYVVRGGASPRGLRRYAWSETGGDQRYQSSWEYNNDTGGYRLYGQPRDFRRTENQFINERGFARRINQEAKAPGSYTYGAGYRTNDTNARRGSVSS